MLTKGELVQRLQLITSDFHAKFDIRPTKEVLNASLNKVDKKLTKVIEA